MKKVETIQTAIETRAKINLAHDIDALHKVFMNNRDLLKKIMVIIPDTNHQPTELEFMFGLNSSIRQEIFEKNIEAYVQKETDILMKQVNETQRDLDKLRNVIAKDLVGLRATLNDVVQPSYDIIAEKIKQVLCKIEGD